jgi:hypothetical protein
MLYKTTTKYSSPQLIYTIVISIVLNNDNVIYICNYCDIVFIFEEGVLKSVRVLEELQVSHLTRVHP